MKIGFVGSGKVGCSLGKLFKEKGANVTGYYSQHVESAKEAAAFVGCAYYETLEDVFAAADCVFLTVPDGKIQAVYEDIPKTSLAGKILCHCSGSLAASECFCDAENYGASRISIHPLFPVSSRFLAYEGLVDAFFVLEGDESALETWEPILQSMLLRTRRIETSEKVRYHAACAIASNLVCGILEESIRLMEKAGFTGEEALTALGPLVKANLQKVLEVGPKEALTGPMERGDIATIQKHLDCLPLEKEKRLYASVSDILLELSMERHPERSYEEIQELLQKYS